MIVLVVVLLTALPMAACGYAGWRLGGRRLAASMGGFALASGVGIAGTHFGWTWPFGLLTPAVATLLTAVAVCWLALRWAPAGLKQRERSWGLMNQLPLTTLHGAGILVRPWQAEITVMALMVFVQNRGLDRR